jgi:hypothetical protein
MYCQGGSRILAMVYVIEGIELNFHLYYSLQIIILDMIANLNHNHVKNYGMEGVIHW